MAQKATKKTTIEISNDLKFIRDPRERDSAISRPGLRGG